MNVRTAALCAFAVTAYVGSTALVLAVAPIEVNDLVGTWRNVKEKEKKFTLTLNADKLELKTPKYSDWEPRTVDKNTKTSYIRFTRKTTEDDIANMKLVKGQDPPPEAVVKRAAGIVSEAFGGFPKRTSHLLAKECDLTMRVVWTGFDIEWTQESAETGNYTSKKSPESKEEFKQIRYAWPDLRKSIVNTSFTGSSATATEINSYFSEHAAMQLYGEFGIALFKPIYKGITGAVPAETFLGKIAEKLFETIVTKELQGDLKLKDFATVIAGQVIDKVLEGVADREPFASIKAKLDKAIGADQVEALGGKVKDKAAEMAADKLPSEDANSLGKYLQEQCRYDIVKLDAYGVVLGGMAVVDKQLGNARVWLLLRAHGREPAIAVVGETSVPEEGTNMGAGTLSIAFSPLR